MENEVFRLEEEVCREGPAMKVAFAAALTDRAFECAGLGLHGSPPLSARDMRPSGFAGGCIDDERALLAEADIS